MRILVLEIGDRSVGAVVIDAESETFVTPVVRHPLAVDRPTPEAVEVPSERLWSTLASAARRTTFGVAGIEAVALVCQPPGLVLLSRADRPLMPIWTSLDRRSRLAARQISTTVGQDFLAETGNRPLPGVVSVVGFRQLITTNPYLLHDIKSYLHVNGWLGLHLTGNRYFDPANASLSGLFGTLTDGQWSKRWCNYFEVAPEWLPPVVSGDTTIGTLRSAIAAHLGIPAGLPVKIGTTSMSSALLAAQLTTSELLHMEDDTQQLAILPVQPQSDPRHLTCRMGVGDRIFYVAYNPVAAVAFDWVHNLCFRDQSKEEFYSKTMPLAAGRADLVTLDPAYLGGDQLEIEAHRASLRNLTLATDRLDLLAAVLAAFRRKQSEALSALGVQGPFRRVVLTGCGSEKVRGLGCEYQAESYEMLDEAPLQGTTKLFLNKNEV